MKKVGFFFFIVIIIICGITYIYFNYKANYNIAKKENKQLESYYNEEIYGADLSTIINKAADTNTINQVEKNEKGNYIDNQKNSINIDIIFSDDKDKIYNMEKIYTGGIENFIKYYNLIKFKCTKIEYHQSTNKIKYMLFEQITQ